MDASLTYLEYKLGSAFLFAAIFTVASALFVPQAVSAYEGNKIDSPPASWKSSWKRDYRIYLYSEANGSRHEVVLEAFKQLLVEILNAEGVDVTVETVFEAQLPSFAAKPSDWQSALAYLYTKCGDNLYSLHEIDKALELYKKSTEIYRGLDNHVAATYAGIADVHIVKGDLELARQAREYAVIASCDSDILRKHSINTFEEGAKLLDEIVIVKSDCKPSTQFVSNLTSLGIVYVQCKQADKALRIFLSLVRLIAEMKEQQSLSQTRFFSYHRKIADESKLKLYIAETLWSLGFRQESLEWTQMSYDDAILNYIKDNDSGDVAKAAMGNMAKIYKSFGREEDANEAALRASRIANNVAPSIFDTFSIGFKL
ncbi:hypothetical protein V1512DRAFT_259755 [Lipomyces arxii]|uniref:uncharacterized protein n=1 Tax=Lipomyces arxii TaxID=56418 RepID=UPI0034CEE72A